MGLSVVMFPPSNFQYVNTCQWHLLLESESLDGITRKEKQPFIGLLKQWEASLEASNCPLCQWMETARLRMKPTLRRVGLRWKKLPDMVWTPALIHAFIHCYPSVSSYSLSVKSVWAGPLWLNNCKSNHRVPWKNSRTACVVAFPRTEISETVPPVSLDPMLSNVVAPRGWAGCLSLAAAPSEPFLGFLTLGSHCFI